MDYFVRDAHTYGQAWTNPYVDETTCMLRDNACEIKTMDNSFINVQNVLKPFCATRMCDQKSIEMDFVLNQNKYIQNSDNDVLSDLINELPSLETIETGSRSYISQNSSSKSIDISVITGSGKDTAVSHLGFKQTSNQLSPKDISICSTSNSFTTTPIQCPNIIPVQNTIDMPAEPYTADKGSDNDNFLYANKPCSAAKLLTDETSVKSDIGNIALACNDEESDTGLTSYVGNDLFTDEIPDIDREPLEDITLQEDKSVSDDDSITEDMGIITDSFPLRDGFTAMPNGMSVNGILPKCRVCGRKATGFHYGVYTCEACKGFFRRALAKGRNVVFPCRCTNSGSNVWKTGPIKNGCPSCRHKRCVFVGMDKKAIKKGRYTLEQKHQHIDAMKRVMMLRQAKATQENQHEHSHKTKPEVDRCLCSLTPSALHMVDGGLTQQPIISRGSFPQQPITSHGILPHQPIISHGTLPQQPIIPHILSLPDDHWFTKQCEISESKVSVKDVEELVATLNYISKKQCRLRDKTRAERKEMMRQRHAECIHNYNMKTAIFGEMRPLSKQEHLEIYKATGIDVDDRYDDVRGALQFFERKVHSLIEFAKAIPGFTSLHTDDQASLIKGSRAMSVFIGGYNRFLHSCNMELKVIAVPWGKAYHLNELTKIYPRSYFMLKFQLAHEMKNLGLSKEEELIMRAMSITLGDRCQLKDSSKVHSVYTHVMQYFKTMLSKRITDPDPIIKNVFAMFLKLRELTDLDNTVLKELFQGWPSLAHHQLLQEFFNRCQLKDSAKVHTMYANVMQYFKTTLSKRTTDPDSIIKNVFAMFLKLRELTDRNSKVLKELFQGWPSLAADHQLLHEFFDS